MHPEHPSPTESPVLLVEAGPDAVLDAARIWARATACRDGLSAPPDAAEKAEGINNALATEGSQLIIARRAADPLGFAVLVPQGAQIELLYLAVDPDAWSRGVAKRLLRHVEAVSEQQRLPLELWVIADNSRAIAAYESAGWTATSETKVRNAAGRIERRFVRH